MLKYSYVIYTENELINKILLSDFISYKLNGAKHNTHEFNYEGFIWIFITSYLVVAIVQHRGWNIYLMLIYTLYNTSKLREFNLYTMIN